MEKRFYFCSILYLCTALRRSLTSTKYLHVCFSQIPYWKARMFIVCVCMSCFKVDYPQIKHSRSLFTFLIFNSYSRLGGFTQVNFWGLSLQYYCRPRFLLDMYSQQHQSTERSQKHEAVLNLETDKCEQCNSQSSARFYFACSRE